MNKVPRDRRNSFVFPSAWVRGFIRGFSPLRGIQTGELGYEGKRFPSLVFLNALQSLSFWSLRIDGDIRLRSRRKECSDRQKRIGWWALSSPFYASKSYCPRSASCLLAFLLKVEPFLHLHSSPNILSQENRRQKWQSNKSFFFGVYWSLIV